MKCPYCNSTKLNVYRVIQKSRKNFRYISCQKCNKTFKTIEYIPSNWDYERLYKGLSKDLYSLIEKYKNNYDKEGGW